MTAAARRTYLVECYAPGIEQGEIETAGRRARAASAELRGEGIDVEYVNAILVPGDEVVFHVFEADDAVGVREASSRAELPFERVVESFEVEVDA